MNLKIGIEQIYVLTWKYINNIGSHNFELNAKTTENNNKFNPNSIKTKHLLIKKTKAKIILIIKIENFQKKFY